MNKTSSESIKELREQLVDTKVMIACKEEKYKVLVESLSSLRQNRNNLAQKILHLEEAKKDMTVSDHAVLRFLERCCDFDIEAVRERILKDVSGCSSVDCHYPIAGEDVKAVIKSRNVVTIK